MYIFHIHSYIFIPSPYLISTDLNTTMEKYAVLGSDAELVIAAYDREHRPKKREISIFNGDLQFWKLWIM